MTKTKKIIIAVFTLIVGSGEVFSQTSELELNERQKRIVGIAALGAKGNQVLLASELASGLDGGLTINETKEIFIQLSAYAGFPRSLNAINTLKKVADERKANGKTDLIGKEAIPLDTTMSRYQLGKNNLEKLSGRPEGQKAGYAEYVPVIEIFLKEHLFADIFSRGILSYQDRELVTVSALASMGGLDAQLQAHLGLSLTNGLTGSQLQQMLKIVGKLIGANEASAGTLVLNKVLAASANNK
ncbi:carboxymuconolactone decarboxylase family protein [Pedobacter aquatilis]|uniref:carboxymuconolactone decarboxylase family protein n=1 Tax=Pedobacter aquatilis TaxID=351343 RepID=UPI00292D5734|nr:carboxymuconolactone decarboxylase family protein [Pedobacter aquatilis]